MPKLPTNERFRTMDIKSIQCCFVCDCDEFDVEDSAYFALRDAVQMYDDAWSCPHCNCPMMLSDVAITTDSVNQLTGELLQAKAY